LTVADNTVTYNEFYAEALFAQIKTDLNYMGDGVASVGYPGVLKTVTTAVIRSRIWEHFSKSSRRNWMQMKHTEHTTILHNEEFAK
jgi:hypothetical protein